MADESSERQRGLTQLVQDRSGELSDYLELADLLFIEGHSEKSLAILKAAAKLPLSPLQQGLLLNEQAQFLSRVAGNDDEALALAEQALTILRQQRSTAESILAEASSETLIAEALWDINRPYALQVSTRALETVQRYADSAECDPQILSAMCSLASRLHTRLGNLKEAIEWSTRALSQPLREDERIAPLIDLGSLLRQVGRIEEANQTLKEALFHVNKRARHPNPRLFHELGLVSHSLGKLRDAKGYLEKALEIVEGNVFFRSDQRYVRSLHFEIADLLGAMEEFRAQATLYRKVLAMLEEDEPDFWECRLAIARCEIELKRYDEARESLERIFRGAPSPEIREAAKADLIRLRYEMAGRDYEAGDYNSCITACKSILGDAYGDDTLWSNTLLLLGHAQVDSGNLTEGRDCYERLIKSGLTPELQRKIAEDSIARLRKARR